MKRAIYVLLLVSLITIPLSTAYAAQDVTLTITIPSIYVSRVNTAIQATWPIPKIENPDYIDSQTTPNEPEEMPEFTPKQWAKKLIIKYFLRDLLLAYECNRDAELAKDAVVVPDNVAQ